VGADQTGTTWDFTEGANSWQFETYLLLANPNLTTAASVTLTFTRTDGTVITSSITVPAGGRVSLWTKGITGLSNTSFRTVVAVTNGIGIVAERATYWPLTTGGGVYGAAAMLAPGALNVETGADTDVPAVQTFDPYAATSRQGTPPRLYQRLVGYPGRTGTTLSTEAAPDTGPPGGSVGAGGAATESLLPSTSLAGSTTTITVSWYGTHLTGGRRR
jgi:hypothetical protein